MAKTASKSDDEIQKLIAKRLRKLEKLSPTQIRKKIAGHRRGLNQENEVLANWLCEELQLPRLRVKAVQSVERNLEVEIVDGDCTKTYKFHVGTSLQDFLKVGKQGDRVPGASLSSDQAVLIRAMVDRQGGDEKELILHFLAVGMSTSPLVKDFVRQVKRHPEWHEQMHNAGLYPHDIFAAWEKVRKAAKRPAA